MKSLLLLLFSGLVGCSNSTYYRSHDELVVVAGAEKSNWFSWKFSDPLVVVSLHNHNGDLLREYPELSVAFSNGDEMTRLASIAASDLNEWELSKGRERQIPYGYPDDAVHLRRGGSSLILNAEGDVFLGARLHAAEGESVQIGGAEKRYELPMSISSLRQLFGDGHVFNVFEN